MATETPCQTPGTIFHVEISPGRISCAVDLAADLHLTHEQAEILDANLHNAVEQVLARYFV